MLFVQQVNFGWREPGIRTGQVDSEEILRNAVPIADMNDAAGWYFGLTEDVDMFDAMQVTKDIGRRSLEVIDPGIRRWPVFGDGGHGLDFLLGDES